jgi:hypothetical protein
MDGVPFFIVGCGRSGTTLLRNLLNAHPDTAIPLESLFVIDYLRSADRYSLDRLRQLLVNEPEIREWGLEIRSADLENCDSIEQCLGRIFELYASAQGKSRWGQKTPRFVRSLPLLLNSFPSAKFIHVVRDPRAVVNSLIRSDVHRSNPYHASRRWLMDVKAGLQFEEQHSAGMLRVRYEDLVSNSGDVLDHILEFLELSRVAALDSTKLGTSEFSAFYDHIHANLDRPLTSEHAEKWKRELTERDVQVVESICADLMSELGYTRIQPNRDVSLTYVMRMQFARLPAMLFQMVRYLRFRRSYLAYLVYRKWKLGLLRDFLWTVNY